MATVPQQRRLGRELEQLLPLPSTTQQSPGNTETERKHIGNVPVATGSSDIPLELTNKYPGWTPFFLKTKTLVGFATFYFILLLAVVALAIVDAKYDGISTAKSSEHYLWTFGPTAGILVCLHSSG